MQLRKSPKLLEARYEELCKTLTSYVKKNKKKTGSQEFEFVLGELKIWADESRRTVLDRIRGQQGNKGKSIEDVTD